MSPAHLKAIATLIESALQQIEAEKGAQPRLRHALHLVQNMTEDVMGMSAGTITPDGGGGKPQ